jgi:hypothetical protein
MQAPNRNIGSTKSKNTVIVRRERTPFQDERAGKYHERAEEVQAAQDDLRNRPRPEMGLPGSVQ